ncbi:Transcriptional regulator protein-like protein [Nitrosotalea devaniterrae]|uniref:Transcriptional regulator protein-like protein n=1 Tax=Nitrosotalea devaniterrae TaxID=1078905 RepID=A0A128A461_9ARCH|nr:Transcriptional regulator protein-like protein [Candidatus Nitrosotalea devanaterra]
MKADCKNAIENFLELASEQRLEILLGMKNGPVKVSAIAKELNATVPEVYRNFERLVKAELISKNPDGSYGITSIGYIMCSQVPLIEFLSKNKKYFKDHNFAELPTKFVQRLGALEKGEVVTGFVKVLDKWKEIYNDADKYICNILFEVPYTSDLMEPLANKINSGVKLRSIFLESAIIPHGRKQAIDKFGFLDMIKQDKIERRMNKNVKTVVILNESEALVMFPTIDGSVDIGEALFSQNSDFHEWSFDYFEHCWQSSGPFRESKFKE